MTLPKPKRKIQSKYQYYGNLKPKEGHQDGHKFDSQTELQAYNKLLLTNKPEDILIHQNIEFFNRFNGYCLTKNIDFVIPKKSLFVEVKNSVITPEFDCFIDALLVWNPSFLHSLIIAVPNSRIVNALKAKKRYSFAVSQGLKIIPFSQLTEL